MKIFSTLTKNEKNYLLLILALSFCIKLVLAFTIEVELRSDSMVYDVLAKNLIEFGEYSFEGKLTALLISGYPFFLAGIYSVFGTDQVFVKIIQSLLEIATCYLFFLCALRFFDKKFSLIALAIFAFFPSNILFSQTVLTEPLFGLLQMSLLYLCLCGKPGKNVFFIGLLWGAAIMVRSSFALSVILIPLYYFYKRKEIFTGSLTPVIKNTALFILGVFIFLAPWLIRNQLTMGSFTLATQGGFTFWSGSNPDATGSWYYKIEESDPLFNEQDEVKRDKEFYRRGIDYAVHNPHKWLITGIKKLGYLFSSERMIVLYFIDDPGGEQTSTQVYKSANPLFNAVVNIPYFIVMLLGTWGLLAFRKNTFFIYGFILTWMATIFIFVALARYHYVLIPFFVLGTANTLYLGKMLFAEMNLTRKVIAAGFSLFLLGVWVSEFYLLLKS